MIRYALKRLLLFVPMLLGVIFIVFAICDLTPGDPARLILGERATETQLAILRADLGLERPLPVRYAAYVGGLLHGDWGTSYRTGMPVIGDILRKFPNTLILALLGVFFSSLIGISVGVFSAVKQGTHADTAATVTALFFSSIPGFWLGMMLILVFALSLGLLPSNGASSWRHFILPAAALTFPASAGLLRLTRAMMLETLHQDYIRTAYSRGLGHRRVILIHALKNALIPVITSMGLHLGYLLGGAVITESVFAIPGLGTHIINAIRMKDTPVVLASTVFLSIFFSLIMLAVDLIAALLDPRLRFRHFNRGGRR
ncbi:peptide ABC transporter permease [Spirochaetia bacterium]|nr:peptide ABC transporter permease [Spirochaetia bacterium]